MGTITIKDKYSVDIFGYEDGNVVLNGSARYNNGGQLTNVDGGQATKNEVSVGSWYAYRDGGKMKLNLNNFEVADMVAILPVINECINALEVEE